MIPLTSIFSGSKPEIVYSCTGWLFTNMNFTVDTHESNKSAVEYSPQQMCYLLLFEYCLLLRLTLTVPTPTCPADWTRHNPEDATHWHWDISGLFTFFFCCTDRLSDRGRVRDREGLHPDLFWIERGWHPVCPTICVMFLASHQALLSGNSARRLMCAGGAAEHSANSVQQIWILCHMTAPKGAENHGMLPLC